MNKKVLARLGLLDRSEIDESWDVYVHIACECKCKKCGKIHRFDGYSYSDFKKLCKTTDFSLEKAIMENVIYVCDECNGDAEIVDIVDGGVYYE